MGRALEDRYEWLTSVGGGRTEERNIKQQRPPKEGDDQEGEGGSETGRPRDRKEALVWPREVGAFPSSSEGSPLPRALGRPILCAFHSQNKPSPHQSPTFGPTLYKSIVMDSIRKLWPYTILLVFIIWCNKKLHYEIFFFPSIFCYCDMVTLVIIISFSIFNVWSLIHPYLFNFWAFITFSFCCIICVNH